MTTFFFNLKKIINTYVSNGIFLTLSCLENTTYDITLDELPAYAAPVLSNLDAKERKLDFIIITTIKIAITPCSVKGPILLFKCIGTLYLYMP